MNFRGDGASTEAIAADLNSANTVIKELSNYVVIKRELWTQAICCSGHS
jgi:hypothetical protein